jgi:hypothetical protein
MGAVPDAVDTAAHFIGPFIGKGPSPQEDATPDAAKLVEEALSHLQAIDAAEKAADPDSPYDGSLVGVVYGLLDLITSLGILPYLSPGVAFGQRPQSVLVSTISVPPSHDENILSKVVNVVVPIFEQKGTGVQPLLSQRVLTDIISALAELAYSPRTSLQKRDLFTPVYKRTISETSTSRLLPVLTTLTQHDVPSWWKPRSSLEFLFAPTVSDIS